MTAKIDQAKMQAGRLRKQREREEELQLQQERRRQEEAAAVERERRDAEIVGLHKQYADLTSMVSAIYAEMDKISKKSPRLPVTDLGLSTVNDAIAEVKEFVNDDRFLDRITRFEPAGDLPPVSDVVLMLSQIRAALDRFGKRLPPRPPRTPEERILRNLQVY